MNFLSGLDMSVLYSLYVERSLTAITWWIRVSELGSSVVVAGLTVCIALIFAAKRRFPYAAGILVSVFGSGAVALALKELVHRARPDALYQAYLESGYAFPSGHATLAMALYGYCIFLVWRLVPSRALRFAITVVLSLIIAAVSCSRVYLGVHYMSDVVGGLIVGTLFVYFGMWVTRRIERRSTFSVQDRLE